MEAQMKEELGHWQRMKTDRLERQEAQAQQRKAEQAQMKATQDQWRQQMNTLNNKKRMM